MAVSAKHIYTPEQYLATEREAEHKSEYMGGHVYAMSGASRAHNLIAGNIFRSVGNQFEGRSCEVYMSDIRVKVPLTGAYLYPDVVALCDKPHLDDAHRDVLLNPVVIVEVLSASTEAYDRGEKFAHYRRLASLMEYVLVAQDKVRVEHYVRSADAGESWVLTELSDPDDVLRLASIGCEISLKEIYEKVNFPLDSVLDRT